MGIERRKLKRFMTRIPAIFRCGPLTGKGFVKNLSKEGLFLRTDRLPKPGMRVQIVIEGPDGGKIEVVGMVRWTTEQIPDREPQPGFGMRFDGVTEDYIDFFERVLLS
jgi:hypothetical protein